MRLRYYFRRPRLFGAASLNEPQASASGPQESIKAAYYRGGTSRALIFQPQHLPDNRAKWPAIFRQLMGSPDPYGRQLDGMGAGISSLSKICLVEKMRSHFKRDLKKKHQDIPGSWIDYTFVGIGIENDEVDVAGNCGNMSSAIGPYAYNAGLLSKEIYDKANGDVTVRIRNTNTGKFIDSTFSVARKQAAVFGDYAIDGVAGTGSRIKLDFQNPYGSKTGKVLPTGKRIDIIAGYKVTCVDGANPCIFIRADDLSIDGTILPADFNKLPAKLTLLESIRKAAAVAMGIAKTEDEVPRTIPKIGIVSMSSSHEVLSGVTLKSSQMDLVVRFISDTQPHRAIPLTAALTTAVAARITGTVVEQLLAPEPIDERAITIGHASGRIQVNATMESEKSVIPISASVYRTSRRIFEGDMFWTDEPQTKPALKSDGEIRQEPAMDYPLKHSRGLAFVEESRGRNSSYLYNIPFEDEELPLRTIEAQSLKDHPTTPYLRKVEKGGTFTKVTKRKIENSIDNTVPRWSNFIQSFECDRVRSVPIPPNGPFENQKLLRIGEFRKRRREQNIIIQRLRRAESVKAIKAGDRRERQQNQRVERAAAAATEREESGRTQ
ncbi:DUF453-domain-containing protein [Pleomassaria siparia CBS 279.74]|uniref:DUF453-domain-containing protein n=1 Tax=Pleomassaria siparia CBS 279.74 TaxID=1314801 RepID=A0A6G1K7A8_9PLEO|nr:DUF453-domain-containing protein [Pleomassaria siparia CBS 279.74]